jgi:hypothetical protein
MAAIQFLVGGVYINEDTDQRGFLIPGSYLNESSLDASQLNYLVPGGAYVYEAADQQDFLIPGEAYLNETTTLAVSFATPWVE